MKKLLLLITMLVASSIMKSQTLLHYFKFNNSLANQTGTASFTGGNQNVYGIGMDVTNIGKRVVTGDNLICTLPNLPQGNSPRSFSIWSRFPGNATTQYIFSYGTGAANQAFGISHGNNLNLYGWSNDLILASPSTLNTWYHYVCTYDGSTMKLYLNGALVGSKVASLNTTGTNAYIGNAAGSSLNSVNALVDELQIYSGALTQEQVTYLWTVGGPVPTLPEISAINSTSNGTSSATINYSLNANGSATTSVIKYGTSASSLTNQVNGFSSNSSTISSGTATLTGLVNGTVYYYQIEASNSNGTTSSTVSSFTNVQPEGIVSYEFNNSLFSTTGNQPFTSNASITYIADRNGNPNSAINFNNVGTTAAIANLPYGSSPRTISVWIRMNTVQTGFNFIYNYGTSSGYYGSYFSGTSLFHFANNSSHSYSTTTPIGEWIHFAFSYNGSQSKIYKNGVLVGTENESWNTINNSNLFRLGQTESGANGFFNGAVDDLKIFGSALSDAEITNLYTNNSTLSSHNFNSQNLKATIYPNPTSDKFTIEIENKIKSVEIYSIQGQKVMTSKDKNVNVSNLLKGMYLVRIEDENNAVATQKLIIK